MRFVALAVALCVSGSALAEPKLVYVDSDTPILDPAEPATLIVTGGRLQSDGISVDVGPGLFLNEPAAVALGKAFEYQKAENEALKESLDNIPDPGTPTLKVIAISAVSLLVGVGLALGYKELKR